MIRYEGTVRGFRECGLRELRKAAMAGLQLANPQHRRLIQRRLRRAAMKDLSRQILTGGDAA
ncbi:MAG: hypothetical protein QME79_11340 [Bacillota bacterium]|nr:hypothetical protein [Bacillota bacterium]